MSSTFKQRTTSNVNLFPIINISYLYTFLSFTLMPLDLELFTHLRGVEVVVEVDLLLSASNSPVKPS